MYPLQMMEILDQPLDKIAIDLVTDLNVSMSENEHILIIIDHLMGWPEAFHIPNKKADIIVNTIINNYLHVHMCPRLKLCDNGTEFKNQLIDDVLKLGIDHIFSAPFHPQSNGKPEVFHIPKTNSRNCVRMTRTPGTNTSTRYLPFIV